MSRVIKIVEFAVVVILFVILVNQAMTYYGIGKDANKKGSEGLASALEQLDSSTFDTYDGMTVNGNIVRQLINQTFSNANVEVLVCTSDGNNLVYNLENSPIFGAATQATSASDSGASLSYDSPNTNNKVYLVFAQDATQILSNLPQYDARGLPFEKQAGATTTTAQVCKAPATTSEAETILGTGTTPLELQTGYNSAAKMSNPGYISDSAFYSCSVQKDVNGDARRITFIQR